MSESPMKRTLADCLYNGGVRGIVFFHEGLGPYVVREFSSHPRTPFFSVDAAGIRAPEGDTCVITNITGLSGRPYHMGNLARHLLDPEATPEQAAPLLAELGAQNQ